MKIMAIDYGDAHTGIAISDYTETLAGHSEALHSRCLLYTSPSPRDTR